MKTFKLILQIIFYSFVLVYLLYRAVSSGISHDENQFVAAGQFVAYHGWLPYLDFPYTHMPYGLLFYALTAKFFPYDYLAGRLLGAVAWLACIFLIVAIFRLIGRRSPSSPSSYAALFGEFSIVLVFLYHPIASYVLGAALNHSYATLFSLLSFYLFFRGLYGDSSLRSAALGSAASIALAALIRLNYASLIVILLALWLLYIFTMQQPRSFALLRPLFGGMFVVSLPALVLIALAPAAFYYGNIVYIRLNTLYYKGVHFRQNMDLAAKAGSFLNGLLHSELDFVLYAILLLAGVFCTVRFIRNRSPLDFAGVAASAFAATLFLTAFSPTPTQGHYFFAPLPFMLIVVAVLALEIDLRSRALSVLLFCVLLLALIATAGFRNPLPQLSQLLHPSEWRPLQVHDWSESLKEYVPEGRMLTLFSMIPMDAGYDAYGFTATGPFSWRTSLLLTAERRAYYSVTSPEELPALLDASPPAGILTGFEAPNAGFTLGDLGGLETPFMDYAMQHGYKPVPLSPKFLEHTIILWIKPSQ